MPWYVYGVTRTGGEPLPGTLVGVEDAPVQVVGNGDLRVVTSRVSAPFRDLAEAPDEDVVNAVRQHDDVLREMARNRSLLPVRFGTVLADEAAVDDLLADPDGALRRALVHVDGADEWVLSVTATNPNTDTVVAEDLSPGHAFFARRRSAEQQRQLARSSAVAVAGQVDTRLRELARDFRPLDLRGPGVVARGAYLVPREVSDQFIQATHSHGEGLVEVQGPLPPYRFAEPTS